MLYRSLPELHRRQDEGLGYPLAKLVEGERPSLERMRHKIQQFGDLRDPLVVRSQYDVTTQAVLGKRVITKGAVIQRGFNGSVTAFGEFVSPTMRLINNLAGKELEISRSTNPTNNKTVSIASVIEPTKALTAPALAQDAGLLTWELREPSVVPIDRTDIEVEFGDVSEVTPGWILFDGYAEYEVLARTQLPSRTEREGDDGVLSGGNRTLTGVVSVTAGNATVTGVGTLFLTEVAVGGYLKITTQENIAYTRVAKVLTNTAVLLVEGYRGASDADIASYEYLKFAVISNQFTLEDIGKRLTISGSSSPANNDKYEILNIRWATVTDPGYVTGDFSYRLAEISRIGPSDAFDLSTPVADDVGPLHWALLPRPRLSLRGRVQGVRGVAEQTNYEISTSAPAVVTVLAPDAATVKLPSGKFSPDLSGSTASITGVALSVVTISGLFGMEPGCVGRRITISGAADPRHNSATATPPGSFEIVAYVNSGSVQYLNTDVSLPLLAPDLNNGSVGWSYLSVDRGKLLSILGSGTANGTTIITSVLSPDTVTVGPVLNIPSLPNPFPLAGYTGPLEWALRVSTAIDDLLRVRLRAPSLLQYLAQDFGVDIDIRETEARQRSWVKNNAQWIGRKGTAKAYSLLGAISGFSIEAAALYRISQDISLLIPSASLYEPGEVAVGRHGIKGRLIVSPALTGRVRFYTDIDTDPGSPEQAVFKLADVGRQIRIQNSAITGNNKLYTIDSFIDSRTVEFRLPPDDPATLPDFGLLKWNVARLYTTLPPTQPRYDDMDPILMGQLINPKASLVVPGTGGSITYTAAVSGSGGNDVSIEQVIRAPGPPAIPVVDVPTPNAVRVTFDFGELAANVVTAVEAAGPWNTAISAAAGTGTMLLLGATNLVGGEDNFAVDRFCWEEDVGDGSGPFISTIPNSRFPAPVPPLLEITGVVLQSENLWSLTIAGPMNVVQSVSTGNWRLTDSSNQVMYLESLPVETAPGSGIYTVLVFYGAQPATGEIRLDYDCSELINCDSTGISTYCPASKIVLNIVYGSVLNDAELALELVLRRMMQRIEQVTPAHVETISRFSSAMEASLNITVEFSAGKIIYWLMAPVQGYYENFPGDMYYFYDPPDPELLSGSYLVIPDNTMLRSTAGIATAAYTGTIESFGTPIAVLSGFLGPISDMGWATITLTGAATPANNGTFPVVSVGNTATPISGMGYTFTTVSYTNMAAVLLDANNGRITASLDYGTTTGTVSGLVGTTATISGFLGALPSIAGMSLTISGAATPANNGTFVITGSATTLTTYTIDYTNPLADISDVNNGSLLAVLS